MEIFTNFGIQPVLLLAQIVNFLVILFVLKRFFYKPITKALDERKERIAESLKNADQIELRLKETEEKSVQILEKAQKEAQEILRSAKEDAQKMTDAANVDTKVQIEEALTAAKAQIEAQKEEMKQELENETVELVSAVVKKVLNRSLSAKEKQQLTSKSLSELTNQIKINE